jgi:hypothetical protein
VSFKKKQKEYKPGILRFKEKHGNWDFWALTQKQFYDSCLQVLTQRFEEGWYYCPEESSTQPEMSLEEVKKLPEGSIRKAAIKAYRSWERERKCNQEAREQYKLIKDAIDLKDGKMAFWALDERNDYEYEGFEVIRPHPLLTIEELKASLEGSQ